MKQNLLLLLACCLLAACGQQQSQDNSNSTTGSSSNASVNPAKSLFINNCAQCHSATKDMTGPKLAGVLSRWGNDTIKLIAFVKDPSKSIADGGESSYQAKLYAQWGHTTMPPFPSLSNDDIAKIIAYIDKGVE